MTIVLQKCGLEIIIIDIQMYLLLNIIVSKCVNMYNGHMVLVFVG